MKLQGKTAKEKFKEQWALDGAPIFDRVINDYVGPPKHYELRANYTIQVTYDRTCGIWYAMKIAVGVNMKLPEV